MDDLNSFGLCCEFMILEKSELEKIYRRGDQVMMVVDLSLVFQIDDDPTWVLWVFVISIHA